MDRIIAYSGQSEDTAIYIVEGVFDAIRLNKMGKAVILLMGTAISDTVVEYLRANKRNVVLVLDNDAAKQQIEHQKNLSRALGEDHVKAIFLPEKDVAEIGLQGGEGFAGFVRSRLK
jgi:DNA primase